MTFLIAIVLSKSNSTQQFCYLWFKYITAILCGLLNLNLMVRRDWVLKTSAHSSPVQLAYTAVTSRAKMDVGMNPIKIFSKLPSLFQCVTVVRFTIPSKLSFFRCSNIRIRLVYKPQIVISPLMFQRSCWLRRLSLSLASSPSAAVLGREGAICREWIVSWCSTLSNPDCCCCCCCCCSDDASWDKKLNTFGVCPMGKADEPS